MAVTALRRLVDERVAGNSLFETDCPHPFCLHGRASGEIDAALGGAAPGLRRQLLFDNAAALSKVRTP